MRVGLKDSRVVAALVLAGVAGVTPVVASEPGFALDVQLRGGRLSARVSDAPLSAVVAEIAKLSGASVSGEERGASVTASFTDLPLAEGVDRLLGGRGHALVQDGERLRRIVLLPTSPSEPDGESATEPSAEEPGPDAVDAAEAAAPGPDATDPALRDALDALTAAVAHDEPGLRAQVLLDAAAWDVDDPSRAIVLARLTADPHPEIRQAALDVMRNGRDPQPLHATRELMQRRGQR